MLYRGQIMGVSAPKGYDSFDETLRRNGVIDVSDKRESACFGSGGWAPAEFLTRRGLWGLRFKYRGYARQSAS